MLMSQPTNQPYLTLYLEAESGSRRVVFATVGQLNQMWLILAHFNCFEIV